MILIFPPRAMHFSKVQFAWNAFLLPVLILLATGGGSKRHEWIYVARLRACQPEHVPALTFDDAFARKSCSPRY
jgi:hypothetical protein